MYIVNCLPSFNGYDMFEQTMKQRNISHSKYWHHFESVSNRLVEKCYNLPLFALVSITIYTLYQSSSFQWVLKNHKGIYSPHIYYYVVRSILVDFSIKLINLTAIINKIHLSFRYYQTNSMVINGKFIGF